MMALALAMVVPALAGQACFIPNDQTAGWKRVDIPDDAPAIAAPDDVEQFRVGEAAWLVERDPTTYQGVTHEHMGESTFHFRLPPEARRLTVGFNADLRGAKVDATVLSGGRRYNLFEGRRVTYFDLQLEWDIPGADELEITVHQHLRPVPVVAGWTVTRWVDLGAQLDVPPAFRVTRSLYYHHPGGQTVQLCNTPGQSLKVERASLMGLASTVRRGR